MEEKAASSATWSIQKDTWRRFTDDVLLLWCHGEGELNQFLDWLNTIHPRIKSTAKHGQKDIPCLDVNLNIVDGRLTTDLYRKNTDANMMLPFNSCHPRHCARGIPFGQILRLRRICSDDTAFVRRCQDIKAKLKRRGYPEKNTQ